MTQQYMRHPLHGRMPVYTPTEIEYNRKHGWELETGNQIESKSPVESEAVSTTGETTQKENGENTCPKCGKSFQRGLTMHMKYCKGP